MTNNYYYPYGGNRGGAFSNLTTKRFTGQYHESSLPGGEGLSYYNARWYDAKLGRFLSADTIVPGPANPQAFNRYSYVLNNPLKLIDPSGHTPCLSSGTGLSFCGSATTSSNTGSIVGTGRYIHTAYGATIDMDHFEGGMYYGGLVLDSLRSGRASFPIPKNLRMGYGLEMEYQILKPVPESQLENVALGIYLHSERVFERWQGTFPMPGIITETIKGSSFSNEDLVSDYLGFYAMVRYPEADAEQAVALIVSQLGGGMRNDDPGPHAYIYPNGYIDGDWRMKNFQTSPRIYLSSTDTWMNIGWPSHMAMTPINNGYWTYNGSTTTWPDIWGYLTGQ